MDSITFSFNLDPPQNKHNINEFSTLEKYNDIKNFNLITPEKEISSTCSGSGLLNAVVAAYNSHENLVLYPNDFVIQALSTLGMLINSNKIATNKIIKNYENDDKINIKIILDGGFKVSDDHILHATNLICEEIKNYIKPEIYDIINMPNFSCGKQIHNLMANIMLMSSMKNKFSLSTEYDCGINIVTLMGNEDDWLLLIKYFERWSELDFIHPNILEWSKVMVIVTECIYDSYICAKNNGQIELHNNFWQTILFKKPRGSGGQKHYQGWILAYLGFIEENYYTKTIVKSRMMFEFSGTKIRYILDKVSDIMQYCNDNNGQMKCGIIKDDSFPKIFTNVDVKVYDSGYEFDIILAALSAGIDIEYNNNNITKYSPRYDLLVYKKIINN